MNGIINLNKPSGCTSFDIVSRIKHLSGEKHVGHAGTLDPMASGVLPICLGQATRIVEYLMEATKTYRAEIELGVVTDTYDAEGQVLRRGDASGVTLEQLQGLLASFQGIINQTPPPYSAVKYKGKPLYYWARAGIGVQKESRQAIIHELKMLDWQSPVVTIEVTCSKGTYIRSLAYDLGEKLGCGASLKSLIRTKYSVFDIKDAVTMSQLEEAYLSGSEGSWVHPFDCVLTHWPQVVAGEADTKKILNGDYPELAGVITPIEGHYRAYSTAGDFIAVLQYDIELKQWKPEKVFKSNS